MFRFLTISTMGVLGAKFRREFEQWNLRIRRHCLRQISQGIEREQWMIGQSVAQFVLRLGIIPAKLNARLTSNLTPLSNPAKYDKISQNLQKNTKSYKINLKSTKIR